MQTYTCPSCKSHITKANKWWHSAIDFRRCPSCQEPLRNFPISMKLHEARLVTGYPTPLHD